MNDSLLQTVSIFNDGTVKLISNFDNKKTSITCQLKDYVTYIASSFGSVATPILPYGCRYYIKKKDKACIIIEKPSFVLPILQTGYGDIDNVTIPRTLWMFDININQEGLTTSRSYCYMLKALDVFSLDMQLYQFIFPHYADWYGGICWGDRKATVASITRELSGFGRLPDLFFNSVSVNHLAPSDDVVAPFKAYNNANNVPLALPDVHLHHHVYNLLKSAPHAADSCLVQSNNTISSIISSILGE